MCAASNSATAAGGAGHVVIIGAGVTGLQTALTLLRASYTVTIVAREFPGDKTASYTSPWAGAQWRTHASDEEVREQRWDLETYEYWTGLVEGVDGDVAGERFGLNAVESRFYWNAPNTTAETTPKLPYFHDKVRNFRLLSPQSNPNNDILPPGATHGASYTSFAITPSLYLSYLVSEIKAFPGARLARAELKGPVARALSAAAELVREDVDAFVVCTGLESATLIPDPDMVAVRGQTMLVRDLKAVAAAAEAAAASKDSTTDAADTAAPTNTPRIMHTYDNALIKKVTYIIPRPGQPHTYLIGGTKIPIDIDININTSSSVAATTADTDGEDTNEPSNSYDFTPLTIPDPATSTDIATRCTAVLPSVFGDWERSVEVLDTMVGLRPGRKGGVRVEVVEGGIDIDITSDAKKEVNEQNKDKRNVNVVFAYGHAGAGYQNSVGCAREVLGLVEGLLARSQEKGL